MARGFESKQVEEQQSMAQSAATPKKEPLTPEQQARQRERANLELARTKIQNDIVASTNERHRAMLELALKDIDEKLRS